LTGGGNCLRLGQGIRRSLSKIKEQILKSEFFFFIKKALKTIQKIPICRAFLTRLAALSGLFLTRINSILSSRNRGSRLKRQISGYVIILTIALAPLLLFGTKYILDKMTENQVKIEKGTGTETSYYKRCAKEAAQAVAENWNPGLTLGQQQAAIYKVADAVYDDSPCYNDSAVGEAVAGLDVKKSYTVSQTGSKFGPIKVTHTAVVPKKTIPYTTSTKYLNRRYYYMYNSGTTWNPNFGLWRAIDGATRPIYRESRFDEVNASERSKANYVLDHHDIYGMPSMVYNGHICKLYNGVYYPNDTYHSPACSSDHSRFVISALNTSTSLSNYSPCNVLSGISYHNNNNYSGSSNFTVRTPSYGSGSVKISVIKDDMNNEDGIQVETDSDKGYPGTKAWAKPAECNVDIVLAIPVNGAANNDGESPYNRDAASDTPGTPVDDVFATASIPDKIKKTPIYQMGQKCKEFVKKFYHTRGVTMGLIPYSAKVSLSPDKVNYTTAITPFASSNDRAYQQKMIGSCLYSTSGVRDANLTQSHKTKSLVTNQTLPTTDTCYYWGGQLTGCPIMCRRGNLDYYANYSGNYSARGLLWDSTSPKNNSNHYYRYMRMNLNPCYMGYANLLSMKCEKQCTHFLPNPYYMIEPTSDMVKIYEMCNALYPIYDKQNVSNFIFIPIEWTYNFWQTWTDNVTTSTVTGTGTSAVLERKSKTTSGRKKALILLVNKPDWFEPGELTYLGFDNDASEIPMAESDKIDFSIDYSDTSKKFLDGSSYNTDYTSSTGEFNGIKNQNSDGTPLVAGPKKIIKYQKISGNMSYNSTCGVYEDTGTSQIRLKIPRPAQVKITVDSANFPMSKHWKYIPQALNPSGYASSRFWNTSGVGYSFAASYLNGTFAIMAYNPYYTAYSTDGGISWKRGDTVVPENYIQAMTCNQNYFVAMGNSSIAYSSNGKDWTSVPHSTSGFNTGPMDDDISWDGTRFFSLTDSSVVYTTTTPDGSSGWSNTGSSSRTSDYEQFKYGGGYYVRRGFGKDYVMSSSELYRGFTRYDLPLSRYGALNYGPGYWLILTQYGDLMKSDDASASSWKLIDGSTEHTTDSSLYKISQKTDWVGICYGGGNWVAYTRSGDVAVTKAKTSNSTTSTTSTIQSSSLPNTSAYTITNMTTFTVDPSKITQTDSDGNYIIDFTCTNLELISAEVTNCIIDSVTPISVTYKDADFDGGNGVLSWSTRSVSEAARTINLTNSAPTSSDGYCVEMTDSTGKLKIASDQLEYVSGYGWAPKHANQDVLLKITSNHGGALTLNVGKWDNGTVTFYTDNIGDTYDVRKDSISGTSISLGTAQTVTGSQEFVFKGGGTNHRFFSGGPNFERNLSVKKVRYLLSNATITNCVLKDQLLREYIHLENSSRSLILNDGTIAQKISGYDSPRATFGIPEMSSTYRSDIIVALRKFRDSCMIDYSSDHSLWYADSCLGLYFGDGSKHIMDIYGVTGNCIVYEDSNAGTTVGILASNGNYTEITGSGSNCWNTLTFNCSSYYSDRVRMLFRYTTCGLWVSLIKNTQDKTLQSTTPITVNPITYQNLIENKGVYLANYNGEKWICFQGDGELEVTTKPEERDGSYYVKYKNSQTNVTSDSQSYFVNWYNTQDSESDKYSNSNEPRYATYVLLHNVYLKSVTQAAGSKYIRTLTSTKQQEIKLVVGPEETGFQWAWSACNLSYSYMRQGVTYGNGMFVLVGGENSSGNGSFYAICENNHAYRSTPDAFKGVAYDEDDAYFYAVTASGNIYRAYKTISNTLSEWTLYQSGGCPISNINRIACGNGYIVVQNTSAQSASLNKGTLSWSSTISQPATCYALCFGAGKFICMSHSTSSTVYSSSNGLSWSQIGSTSFRSYEACNVCYGNGRFLATDRRGYDINISTDGGSTWYRAYSTNYTTSIYDICYGFNGFSGVYGYDNYVGTSSNNLYLMHFSPRLSGSEYKSDRWQVKIGNRSPEKITGRAIFTIAASELTWNGSRYYVDLDIDAGYKRIRVATTGHTTSETVDDLIDFNSEERNGKNGILQATGSYTSNNGYCVANGAPNVSSSHRGRFELRYAYSLASNSTGMGTSTIPKASMTHSGGRYYYNWNWGSSNVLLYLKFYHEPEILYPYDLGNSLNLDWQNNSLGIPSGISVSSYSNYLSGVGYHNLKIGSCCPNMYRQYTTPHPYTSDISVILDSRTASLSNMIMPEYTSTRIAVYLTGVTRLFSQQKRDSTCNYCYLQPNSTAYDNISSLISTNFTIPQNRILTANNYQTSGMTPTAAVARVTADACTKLKNAYGNDLRIYVVKYKPQANYNSYPYENQSSVATAHDYTTVDNCASSSSYLYTASSEDELKAKLELIEQDIKKNFANYKAAEIME